jgi:thiosulfate reductase cytochrome b subunit
MSSIAAVKSNARQRARLHPLSLQMMHWINAVAIFIMVGSGWRIYNDDILFSWLQFPDFLVIGKWAQYGLQWHFFGMWTFVLNGLTYVAYGILTGRFRQKLFPISIREVMVTVGDALRLWLSHEDLTVYNALQKMLYLGVILVGMLIVITGPYAVAGQVPAAASDPDIPISHQDRVYSAEQYSNTVSVTDPVDNKLVGAIHLGDPLPANLSPLYIKVSCWCTGWGFRLIIAPSPLSQSARMP